MKVLEVNNLTKKYGEITVLKNISFDLFEGEIVGFVGPNGAGKTTLMKCLCSLIPSEYDSIRICDYDLKTEREKVLENQSSLIEAPGLYTNMSGKDNIDLFAHLKNTPKERVLNIYEFTGLKDQLKKKVETYSMGMKQRIALGIALLNKPKLLMLDEPMNGLDPSRIKQLFAELIDLAKKEKITILISSHQLSEIERIVDRVLYIQDGKINEIKKEKSQIYVLKTKDLVELNELLHPIKDNNTYWFKVENEKEFASIIRDVTKQTDILDLFKYEKGLDDYYHQIYENE